MSTNISLIFDAVVSRVGTLLPAYKRLSDPYQFLKNTDSEYRQGFGLRVGPGTNTLEQFSCDIILSQQFSIVLTRLVKARETDRDKKDETEKVLLEDMFTIVKDFEQNVGLGTNYIVDTGYLGHNGIEFVKTERDDILALIANFSLRYREDLN